MPSSINVLALQALIFEMNWPTYRWIDRVFIRRNSNIHLYVQYSASLAPHKEGIEACTRMFEEIVSAVQDKLDMFRVDYSTEAPHDDWSEVMSNEVFQRLAAEVAPWRLEVGR